MMAKGALRLSSLTADGKILAIIYGFHHGRKYYFYQSGFDPAYFQLSPGLVLMNFSIEQAIKRGAEEFHFLRGEEEYKAKFTKTFRRTHHIEIWKTGTISAMIEPEAVQMAHPCPAISTPAMRSPSMARLSSTSSPHTGLNPWAKRPPWRAVCAPVGGGGDP